MLAANIASLTGFHHFGTGFDWLNGWTPFYILASASVIEIVAYYIPWLDNALDHIALPVAVAAGTLLSTSFISADWSPALKWGLGILAGGIPAGIIHSGMGLLRLGSTATTGGLANPLVTTAENGASISFSVLALLIPVVIAIVVLLLIFYILKKMIGLTKRKNRYTDVKDETD